MQPPSAIDGSDPVWKAQITLRNHPDELPRLAACVHQFAVDAGLTPSVLHALDLSLTEWITNIIDYGFGKSEPGVISVELFADSTCVRAIVEDNAKAFNPLDRPPVDITLPMEEKPIGGLGIHLMRTLMDEFSHERSDGKNRVILKKHIKAQQRPASD